MPSLLFGLDGRGSAVAGSSSAAPAKSIPLPMDMPAGPATAHELLASEVPGGTDTAAEDIADTPLRGPEASPAEQEQGPASASSAAPAARSLPKSLEGVEVKREKHTGDSAVTPRNQKGYTRLRVLCPCPGHSEKVPGQRRKICERRRGTGPDQTATFGELEPYGFLGAWLSSAAKFPGQREHLDHDPSTAEVREYMKSVGWLD